MKFTAVILLILFANAILAQQRPVSFAIIDERVKTIEPAPPAQLAEALTKDYSSDREKLRSIFSWIAEHIAYRVKKNYSNKPAEFTRLNWVADTAKWQSANDVVAETVLQNRSAVCDGYARLLATLCHYAGIRSEVITGFARADFSRAVKFRCNHTWNAVYLDSAWHLLDVTWASGGTNYRGDEFIKHFDESYFLPAPEDFIRDHFPDDLRWTLMEQPTLPREFNNGPYKNKSFGKYNISSYTPAGGIIEAAVGDTIALLLETTNPQADKKMAADTITLFDSALQKILPSIAFIHPAANSGNNLQYKYCVEDNSIQWLHVVYNHDTVLRYRLKIRKNNPASALDEKTAFRSGAPFSPDRHP